MTRQTSIDAYEQIRSEGLLSKMRFKAYDLLFKYGSMTASELESMEKILFDNGKPNSFMHQRLSELKALGVVCEMEQRPCKISGRVAIVWGVTGSIPIKLEKKKTKDQIIKELKQEIEELNRKLQCYEY